MNNSIKSQKNVRREYLKLMKRHKSNEKHYSEKINIKNIKVGTFKFEEVDSFRLLGIILHGKMKRNLEIY